MDCTKFKAFADDKLNVAKMTVFLFDGIENTTGKEEIAGNLLLHILLYPQSFQKPSSVWLLTLSLLMSRQEAFLESVDQDQTVQNVQSDL